MRCYCCETQGTKSNPVKVYPDHENCVLCSICLSHIEDNTNQEEYQNLQDAEGYEEILNSVEPEPVL